MQILKQIWEKCKGDWFKGLILILIILLAFGLGRWSGKARPAQTPVTVEINN